MTWLNPLLVSVSLLTIGGGIAGFVQKGSVMSIVGGLVIGALIIAGVFVAQKKPRVGRIMSLVGCLAIMGQFLPKAIRESQVWPATVLAVAGLLGVVGLLGAHLMAQKSK